MNTTAQTTAQTTVFAALDRMTTSRVTLVQDMEGNWQPSCGTDSDRLREMGVTFGMDGISTAALDDVLFNVSEYGYWLETIPTADKGGC